MAKYPESEGGKKIYTILNEETSTIEVVVEGLRGVFRNGNAKVAGEFLSLENLALLKRFIVAYQASASLTWGRVKGIASRGEAKVKHEKRKEFMKIRNVSLPGLSLYQSEEEKNKYKEGRIPSQKDAEIMSMVATEKFASDCAIWEGLLARITSASNTLNNFSEAVKELYWMQKSEKENID